MTAAFADFNPRAPCGARLRVFLLSTPLAYISPPAPLGGRDCYLQSAWQRGLYFNPRAPCGARPRYSCYNSHLARFQPTRPLRGATLVVPLALCVAVISTHAPLAGRDGLSAMFGAGSAISTHAPLAGRDIPAIAMRTNTRNFNPRAPCGARRATGLTNYSNLHISTHAPLAGRDSVRSSRNGRLL